MSRRGFSLIEILLVIGVVALLMALLLPAVQAARESARKLQCQSNLKQLGFAIHSYHDVFSVFPAASIGGKSMHVAILPYIEQPALAVRASELPRYHGLAFDRALEEPARHRIPLFKCPSDPVAHSTKGDGFEPLNYLCNVGSGFQEHGMNGFFVTPVLFGTVRTTDVIDGLSNTACLAEGLVGDVSPSLRRRLWKTPYPLTGQGELDQFAALCRHTAITGTSISIPQFRWAWSEGWDPTQTHYHHVLHPNDVSCVRIIPNSRNLRFPQGVCIPVASRC